MLSTTAVNLHASSLQGVGLGMDGTPETGEFDFMNYLLGLQVSPLDLTGDGSEVDLTGTAAKATSGKDGAKAEDALFSIFQKKNDPSWNLIFPNAQVTNQPVNPLEPQEVEGTEIGNPAAKTAMETTNPLQGLNPKSGMNNVAPEASLKVDSNEKVQDAFSLSPTQGAETRVDEKQANPLVAKAQKELAIQKYAPTAKPNTNALEGNTLSPVQRNGKTETFVADNNGLVNSQQTVSASHELNLKEEIEKNEGLSRKRNAGESELSNTGVAFDGKALQASTTAAPVSKGEVTHATTTVPELFQKVESMVHHGGGKMTVSLNPPSLGHVEIQVTTRGKNVEIQMKSQTDFAKSAIESKITDLKHSMQVQDLNLSKMEVHVSREADRSMNGNQFANLNQGTFHNQQQSHGFQRDAKENNSWQGQQTSMNPKVTTHVAPVQMARSAAATRGGVDIRI